MIHAPAILTNMWIQKRESKRLLSLPSRLVFQNSKTADSSSPPPTHRREKQKYFHVRQGACRASEAEGRISLVFTAFKSKWEAAKPSLPSLSSRFENSCFVIYHKWLMKVHYQIRKMCTFDFGFSRRGAICSWGSQKASQHPASPTSLGTQAGTQ